MITVDIMYALIKDWFCQVVYAPSSDGSEAFLNQTQSIPIMFRYVEDVVE